MRRQTSIEDLPNCDIVKQGVTVVMAAAWKTVVMAAAWKTKKLQEERPGLTNNYTTQVPLIVNTSDVQQDEELILTLALVQAKPKAKGGTRLPTWVDQVTSQEKRRKTQG